MRTLGHPRRGANAAEFSILLPVILALTFGAIDYSWYFLAINAVQSAAMDSARVGAQTPFEDGADPASAAITAAETRLSLLYPNGTVDSNISATEDGSYIDVEIEVAFDPIIGFFPTPTNINASAHCALEFEPEA